MFAEGFERAATAKSRLYAKGRLKSGQMNRTEKAYAAWLKPDESSNIGSKRSNSKLLNRHVRTSLTSWCSIPTAVLSCTKSRAVLASSKTMQKLKRKHARRCTRSPSR